MANNSVLGTRVFFDREFVCFQIQRVCHDQIYNTQKNKNYGQVVNPHPDCHFLIGRGRGTPEIKVHLPIIPDFRNHYLEVALGCFHLKVSKS